MVCSRSYCHLLNFCRCLRFPEPCLRHLRLYIEVCCLVAVGAENARTGKTMAEKMVKIMEERLKEKAAVTDKLHSKNHALKVMIHLSST